MPLGFESSAMNSVPERGCQVLERAQWSGASQQKRTSESSIPILTGEGAKAQRGEVACKWQSCDQAQAPWTSEQDVEAAENSRASEAR